MRVNHDILVFLWRWKLVSSTALAAKYFPNLTNHGALWHLRELQRHNLIFPYRLNSTEATVLWGLTAKGFKWVKDYLPSLAEEGFRSEHPIHDFYVTAFHLGNWLVQTPNECDVFTEQELRRLSMDQYPEWVPKTTIHRPDGYWLVSLPEGMAVVALEVELNAKNANRYEVLAKFYRDQPDVFRVVWLVDSEPIAKSIRSKLQKGSPQNIGIHNFVLKAEFLEKGWQATICFGYESGNPISFLLGQRDLKTTQEDWSFGVLDTRKTPHLSELYARFSDAPFSRLSRLRLPYTPNTPTQFRNTSHPSANNAVSITATQGGTTDEP